MKKKIFILLTVILFAAFAITVGVYLSNKSVDQDGNKTETNVAKIFDDYYNARVQNVGNNSKVINLINVLGAGDLGEYTIALQTKTKPYGLSILYSKLKNGVEAKLKTLGRIDYAFYALALIDNLSTVNIKYKTFNYELTLDEANKIIGGNIKDYGKSADKLKELYEKLNPED